MSALKSRITGLLPVCLGLCLFLATAAKSNDLLLLKEAERTVQLDLLNNDAEPVVVPINQANLMEEAIKGVEHLTREQLAQYYPLSLQTVDQLFQLSTLWGWTPIIFGNFTRYYRSETCPLKEGDSSNTLASSTTHLCPRGGICYEPGVRWDVGLGIFSGILKSAKLAAKYYGKREIAAVIGTIICSSDTVMELLNPNGGSVPHAFFVGGVCISREAIRGFSVPPLSPVVSAEPTHSRSNSDDSDSSTSSEMRPSGSSLSLEGANSETTTTSVAKTAFAVAAVVLPTTSSWASWNNFQAVKGGLKVFLIGERHLDWGGNLALNKWLSSSFPPLALSILEHAGRYYQWNMVRAIAGISRTAWDVGILSGMCEKPKKSSSNNVSSSKELSLSHPTLEQLEPQAAEKFKWVRQAVFVTIRGTGYVLLARDASLPGKQALMRITIITVAENILLSMSEALYYWWFLRPTE